MSGWTWAAMVVAAGLPWLLALFGTVYRAGVIAINGLGLSCVFMFAVAVTHKLITPLSLEWLFPPMTVMLSCFALFAVAAWQVGFFSEPKP